MPRLALLAVLLLLSLTAFLAPQDRQRQPAQTDWLPRSAAGLETVAEKSGFKATSTYDQVIDLLDRLAQRSPHARRLSMGQTNEGRDIPVIVFANPPVATAEEAQAARQQGKLVVLLFGNIHAGEVDAKEALLMLARELALTPDHPALAELVIAIAPIYNADGNERFGPIERQRPGQAGPDDGVGQRHNAQDLDLNRDFVKLEAPETQSLVRFMRQWDPAVIMDGHTTNGSLHRFLITHAGAKVPAGDENVIAYTYDKLLPGLTQGMKARTGIDSFIYGNFAEDHTKWTTFPAEARYGTNYIGLRNRLSVLSESYSYASYEDRIRGTLEFSREILSFAAANKGEISQLLQSADTAAARAGERQVALRTQAVALPQKGTALGFEERRVEGQRRPVAGEPREYEVEILDKWQPTLSVTRPHAYLIAPDLSAVIENLQRHGIAVEELREDIELDVTSYRVDEINRAERPFQGHNLVSVEATPAKESRMVPAGSFVVRTAQPLGNLASYLLEPQSEDGLVAWNFFDEALKQGESFPVLRLEEEATMRTTAARPLPEDRVTGRIINYASLNGGGGGRRGGGGGGAARPSFEGSPLGGLRWLDDDHYIENRGRQLMKVSAQTGRAEVFIDPAEMTQALAALPSIGERAAAQIAGGGRFRFTDDFSRTLIDHANDLYVYDFNAKKALRVTNSETPEEMPELSPDGKYVAFVRGFDLYVADVDTQQERALTTGGTDTLRNGKNDWVYFEELYGRSWKAYWWSPDSTAIAFLQTDSSMVNSYTLTNDLQDPIGVEVYRYPKAGSPNPHVKVGIAPVAGGEIRWADTSRYKPEDFLVSGVGWWPDGSLCYFFAQNREQTWLDICTVTKEGGSINVLLRDETEAWVQPEGGPWVLKDGSFLLASERTGWRHIYRFDRNGQLMHPVTQGEWDYRGLEKIDEGNGLIYFSGTKDSHIATNLYAAKLDGSGITRLTQEPGSHSITMSPSARRFIDTWSSRTQPTKVALRSAVDGRQERMLDTNPVYNIDEWVWGSDEQFQIETEDGFLLEASLVKPANFDPSRKYPVWITTYAGPYAPTIRDNWGGGRTWDQMLASDGIVVMRVDPRTASGKGARSAWAGYRQLGVQETKDLETAVAWLGRQGWADLSRIGLSGHSYGGYMTAYAMTHSKAFRAGIAGAPVTDWRFYDTIYTERYMGTPQNNPSGYDAASAVKAAGDLHGELLLAHGAMDDNVHPQNSIRMAKALQDAARPFHLMIYPGMRHGIFGRHYNELQYNFIRRTMGVDGGTESTAGSETERAAGASESGRPRRARAGASGAN